MDVKIYHSNNNAFGNYEVLAGGERVGQNFEYYLTFNNYGDPTVSYNLNTNKLTLNFVYGGKNNGSSSQTTLSFYLKVNNEVLLNGATVNVSANSTNELNITKVIDCNNDGSASNIIITAGLVEQGTENYHTDTYHTNPIRNGHIKINSSWKNAFGWVKTSGSWKRCILWKKINGTWKKGI